MFEKTRFDLPKILPDYQKKDYGIGIIGSGWVVNNYHLPAYRAAGFNVVACCDTDKEKAESTARRFGIDQWYTDYRQVLELKDVEIIDFAIGPVGRLPIVQDCAAAGKHVLAQKPFTRTMEEGNAMVKACDDAGVKLGINSHYRWLRVYRQAYNLIRMGVIGEVYAIFDWMFGDQDEVYYEASVRKWNAEIEDFMYVEWGSHHFDYIRFWAGKTPMTVYCKASRRPGQNFKSCLTTTYSLDFGENLQAGMCFNQASRQHDTNLMRSRIEGTEGFVEVEDYVYLRCGSRHFGNQVMKWDLSPSPYAMEDVDYRTESFIGTMGDLMEAITTGREHISSGHDNMETVASYLAGQRSATEGRIVPVSEFLET